MGLRKTLPHPFSHVIAEVKQHEWNVNAFLSVFCIESVNSAAYARHAIRNDRNAPPGLISLIQK